MEKKTKTGGRVKKLGIAEELEAAVARSTIAALHDETMLPENLAALYLNMSTAALAEMRSSKKAGDTSRGVEGPPMVKIIPKGSIGQNQSVSYRLGDLREYIKKNTSTSSWGAASQAGLLGWCTVQVPFFTAMKGRTQILLGSIWDLANPLRDELFAALSRGEIDFDWMTSQEACTRRWRSSAQHEAFARKGLELLINAPHDIEIAISGTKLDEALEVPKKESRPRSRDI